VGRLGRASCFYGLKWWARNSRCVVQTDLSLETACGEKRFRRMAQLAGVGAMHSAQEQTKLRLVATAVDVACRPTTVCFLAVVGLEAERQQVAVQVPTTFHDAHPERRQ
jgi:hypothetical protein